MVFAALGWFLKLEDVRDARTRHLPQRMNLSCKMFAMKSKQFEGIWELNGGVIKFAGAEGEDGDGSLSV